MSHKKTTRTSHVGEPAKDLAGTTVDTHVRQGGEQSTEDDRDIGETLPWGDGEDFGRVADHSKAVWTKFAVMSFQL